VVAARGCGVELLGRSTWQALSRLAGGFAYGAGVAERAARLGAFVESIPVAWTDDDAGRIRLGRAVGDYARAWLRLLAAR